MRQRYLHVPQSTTEVQSVAAIGPGFYRGWGGLLSTREERQEKRTRSERRLWKSKRSKGGDGQARVRARIHDSGYDYGSVLRNHGETNGFTSDDEDAMGASKGKGKDSERIKGVVNPSGTWCWREDCKECLHLTRGLQKLSDTLQSVADLYDDHMKAELASRCETVLNTTMSEMDLYHTQKVEDFPKFGIEHLDGEIQLYQQILTRLRATRSTLTSPPPLNLSALVSTNSNTITPSIYTRDLFPSTSPTSPGSSLSATSSSRFYPYSNSKPITTSHRFVPSSSAKGVGTASGIGEVQIPALPMPALHVFDGVTWNTPLM
ncbi:hypothetical protein NP233_g12755 [Leucocoprinus birnbaumii]|uniref:Sorting nexin protein WASP-binding domain-containing protein n=1 Tax=Leucocoprinus birnbaumii TaxID=56174 RepID=A0AAD5VI07_9AGAR|nr:hypothetical protein NP233_g12755 [Leucocoprinus birnbaumii]